MIIPCVPTSVCCVLALGALWLTACTLAADLPAPTPSQTPAVLLATDTDVPTPAMVSATPSPTASPAISPSATSIPQGATATFTTRPTQQPIAPTLTPIPPTVRAEPSVRVNEDAISLSVAPYARFLTWNVDDSTGVPFATLDRVAFAAANESTSMRAFKVVHLENEYLQMSFLPELGGRLYQVVLKPSNQNIFYNNPVIMPSRFGPFDDNKNWWLAAGGMEWALPVQEHGYEWGVLWQYRTQTNSDSASITLWDSDAPNRLQTEIMITLKRGEAAWTITPKLTNPTARAMRVQFWLNAMLTLGTHSLSPQTQFTLPTSTVRVHSTGDKRLPGTQQTMPWPNAQAVDFSQYRNWQTWLGVFANDTSAGWVSAHNAETKIKLTRTFPPAVARGVKLFAFGPQFADRSYTSDQSQYFELWGGLNSGFWPEDDATLPPHASVSWTERWLVESK